MPSLIVPAITAIGAAVGGSFGATLIMYSAQIAAGLVAVGGVALSSYQKRKMERKARAAYNAAQVDRLVNVASTVQQRLLVLGRVRTGGHVFFRGSVGQYREKFVMLVALAAHEIDAVEQVYLNDVAVTLDVNGYVQTEPYALQRTESASATFAPGAASITLAHTPVAGSVKVTVSYYAEGGGSGGSKMKTKTLSASVSGNTVTLSGGPWVRTSGLDDAAPRVSYQYTVTDSKARIRTYLGSAGQTADAQVMADFPGLWTVDHRARGVAYLVCEYWYDETAYPSGLPKVTARVRGARVVDPRTGTTGYTDNPALMARHVLLHPQFGKRSSLTAAEDARIIAAANACDIAHDYGEGAVPMFRAGMAVPFGTAARDVLDDLAQAMGGQWAYAAGEFHLRAGVYTAPVLALTEADLAVARRDAGGATSRQAIGISPHTARADKFNCVAPRIWDAAQDYQQVVLEPVKGSALITRDGVELVQEVDMPAVTYAQQAQHVAGIAMRDARDPLTVTLPFKLTAYRVTLFDTVTLTLARYGWAAKEFVVLGRQWTLDGGLLLTLKETAAAIYQPDAEFVAGGYAQNTALPSPWAIDPPTGLDAASGTAELQLQADGTVLTRVRVSWDAVTDQTILQGGSVEVQWADMAAPALAWNSTSTSGRDTQLYIPGAADGTTLLIRARTRNQLAASDWGTQIAHTVLGKTEPPANVAAITVSGTQVAFTPVTDVDLAGYKLRFNYSQDTWWDYAAALHDGLITESPYTLERLPVGECTVMVKAVDTSGNESATAAWAVYSFPEPLVANVLLDYPQHPTFPGAVTDGALVGSVLQADALDDFYAPADGPLYLPSTEAMYLPSQYAAMGYEFSVSPTEPGVLRLLVTITGAYRIEYQTGGGEPMFEPTADPMFEPVDEALFGTPSAWQLWPGELAVDGAIEVRFRITLAAGELQGVITEVTAVLDVPDVAERLPAVAVTSGGTRLPITQSYHAIKTVHLTVHSGGTGTSARIVDKDPALGPLVQVINASGTAVAGTVDADIQGY